MPNTHNLNPNEEPGDDLEVWKNFIKRLDMDDFPQTNGFADLQNIYDKKTSIRTIYHPENDNLIPEADKTLLEYEHTAISILQIIIENEINPENLDLDLGILKTIGSIDKIRQAPDANGELEFLKSLIIKMHEFINDEEKRKQTLIKAGIDENIANKAKKFSWMIHPNKNTHIRSPEFIGLIAFGNTIESMIERANNTTCRDYPYLIDDPTAITLIKKRIESQIETYLEKDDTDIQNSNEIAIRLPGYLIALGAYELAVNEIIRHQMDATVQAYFQQRQ